MLIAFAVIPWITGDTSLVTFPITIVLLVIGGYISKRGITNYFQRASGSSQTINLETESNHSIDTQKPSQTICYNCSSPIVTGDSFCGNCGAPIQRIDTSENMKNEKDLTIRSRDQFFSLGRKIQNKIKRTDVSQKTERAQNARADSGKAPLGKLVSVGGTVLIILSGFLPWAESSSDILKGFGDPILYVVIILAIASLVFVQFKNIKWAPLISGILAIVFGFWIRDPEKLVSFMTGFSLPDIKYGLYVYLLGSVILLLGGILGILKK
jgi:hypothetical protein